VGGSGLWGCLGAAAPGLGGPVGTPHDPNLGQKLVWSTNFSHTLFSAQALLSVHVLFDRLASFFKLDPGDLLQTDENMFPIGQFLQLPR